jgi:tRNA A-37 threonylcarbamoyl transferase component Bud32
MKVAPAIEQPGALIAQRYRVEAMLGRGGMAVVYRVHDERNQRSVALKRCLARERAKMTRYAALLEREYHTLSQLAHPSIIEVYDFGIDARGPFYTMELLDGSDLEKAEKRPWQSTCIALREVASALAMLHSRALLHRDVSLRNVHVTAGGRTKLIDFGTMMSMGVARDVVGTPPFMAPEILQLQGLDGRADLYALGALGYRMLTGRHAYPARRFTDLRDAWRSKPPAPHVLVPDIPPELSALILRLLTLDRAGRPHTAAEVIERLCTIANLEREDTGEISRSYLTTPSLVGREDALVAVRKKMLSLVRGDGGVLMVSGAPGAGRSRVLDACALEGKLLGAAVVRADVRDASIGEWGVASAIGNQLLAQFPKEAAEAARLSRSVLGHLLEDLRVPDPNTVTGLAPERSLIIRELRDWVLSMAKSQRLLLVIDDIERIDDASAAWLSALANKAAKSALLLALSIADDGKPRTNPALRLLCELAQPIELHELEPAQTEALMRSLFGDVANLPACASRVHALAHGNPRATMALAQHLVDTGRARYEAGSWVLPRQLDESDLPHTLAESLQSRLAELSANARELLEVLTLADEDAPLMANYAALTSHRDPKRVFQALDELVAARILTAGVDRYHFVQRGFLKVVLDALPDDRRRGLHTRIARLLARSGGDVLRRVHHLLASGADREGVELLSQLDLGLQVPPVSLLTAAIARAERMGVSASTLHRLRMGVLIAAPLTMDYASFRGVAPSVLARLEQDSGLADYQRLSHLPERERLAAAMAKAQQTYLDTPEDARVHPSFEAIKELARLYGAIPAMAIPSFDLGLLESLPSLEPLFPLSPALRVVSMIVEGGRDWVSGRPLLSRELYHDVLKRISEPDRGGFDAAQHERIYLGLHNSIGLLDASNGVAAAEDSAQLLEKHRAMRVNAWRIRTLLQLARGDLEAAGKCNRRAELLCAQEGLRERYTNSMTGLELLLRSRLGDLLGVKAQLPLLAALAEQHLGWRPVLLLGHSRFRALHGDLPGALDLTLAGLELASPLRHPFFAALAASHIALLTDLGRLDEAVERARHYMAIITKEQITSADVAMRAAIALARAGHHEEAVSALTPQIELAERSGRTALAVGMLYEARARIAIEAGDAATFERYVRLTQEEYLKAHNPALNVQVARLLDFAEERGVKPSQPIALPRASQQTAEPESQYETLHSRMAECVDREDRARCALTLLLQNTTSSIGYLYGMQAERAVTLLAALPFPPADEGIDKWVESFASQWASVQDDHTECEEATETSDDDELATITVSDMDEDTVELPQESDLTNTYTDRDGRYFEAIPLVDGFGNARRLAAVFVIDTAPDQPVRGVHMLGTRVARQLLEHEDVSGWRQP